MMAGMQADPMVSLTRHVDGVILEHLAGALAAPPPRSHIRRGALLVDAPGPRSKQPQPNHDRCSGQRRAQRHTEVRTAGYIAIAASAIALQPANSSLTTVSSPQQIATHAPQSRLGRIGIERCDQRARDRLPRFDVGSKPTSAPLTTVRRQHRRRTCVRKLLTTIHRSFPRRACALGGCVMRALVIAWTTRHTHGRGSTTSGGGHGIALDCRCCSRSTKPPTLLRTTRRAIYAMVERRQLPGVIRIGRRVLLRADDLLHWLRPEVARHRRRSERR